MVNFETIPLDDAAVYEMICACKTVGVFQLESTGMQAVIADLQPDVFTDIIALGGALSPWADGKYPQLCCPQTWTPGY